MLITQEVSNRTLLVGHNCSSILHFQPSIVYWFRRSLLTIRMLRTVPWLPSKSICVLPRAYLGVPGKGTTNSFHPNLVPEMTPGTMFRHYDTVQYRVINRMMRVDTATTVTTPKPKSEAYEAPLGDGDSLFRHVTRPSHCKA